MEEVPDVQRPRRTQLGLQSCDLQMRHWLLLSLQKGLLHSQRSLLEQALSWQAAVLLRPYA